MRSLHTLRPEFIDEWDDEKNTITPKDITIGSDRKVWWKCQQGHQWQASPLYRSRGFGTCLACESLAHLYPEIAEEWHPELNTISPWDVRAGSGKKVWWKGKDCGHEWETVIRNRVRGANCIYCTGQKVLVGFNDLATTHPHLAKHWDHEKNTRKLEETSYGLKTKVWWTDDCGHSWHKSPLHMTKLNNYSCPECQSVGLLHPEILEEWNDETDPYEVLPGSARKIDWKCKRNPKHLWKATPYNRIAQKQGCPYCSGHKATKGENDILTTHTHLQEEWYDEKSMTEFSFGSNYKAKWKCKSDESHIWYASIISRTAGKWNCPYCSNKVSKAEEEILNYVLSLGFEAESNRKILNGRELDIFIPEKNIAIEYNGIYWHSELFTKDKSYHYKKWSDCKKQGIQLITIWEDEYEQNPSLVLEMISHKLGVSTNPKVAGRKTEVVIVEDEEASEFYNAYHIQGHKKGKHLGLRTKDTQELVALSTWKQEPQKRMVYLERYATSRIVQGGFSKVLKHAETIYSPNYDTIYTFSDNSISDGSLYENNGFTLDSTLPPDYSYIVNNTRVHKFNYRKKRFMKDSSLQYVEGMTEKELAQLNKIYRIWDCGKIRWIKEI